MDSAMNQLILVTHKIYTAIDNGQDVSIAFLDISKAFDRVWHRGLVNKLKTIGIRGQLLKWLTDYLENRCQRVVINGVQSPWLTIKAGVPQGSILGPLLFLVYVNDIVTNITSDIYLYADDTILMRIVTDPVQDILQLNVDLEHLNQWAKKWVVNFSAAKSEHLIISRKHVKHNYNPLFYRDIQMGGSYQQPHKEGWINIEHAN